MRRSPQRAAAQRWWSGVVVVATASDGGKIYGTLPLSRRRRRRNALLRAISISPALMTSVGLALFPKERRGLFEWQNS